MKYILSTIMILCSWSLLAQEQYIETNRIKSNNNIAYKDTIYIERKSKDSLLVRLNGFVYSAAIVNKVLGMPYGNYRVIKNESSTIVLEKESTQHVFTIKPKIENGVAKDYEKHKNTNALPTEVLQDIDKNALIGKWEAYKRVSRSGPSDIKDFNSIIKNVEIYFEKEVLSGLFKAGGTSTFLYELKGNNQGWLLVVTPDKKEYKFKVLAQSEREWIFEDNNGIVYYMYRK